MITIATLRNFKTKDQGKFIYDQDIIDHRINNDLPLRDDDLLKDYRKADKYRKKKDPEKY